MSVIIFSNKPVSETAFLVRYITETVLEVI